MRDLKVIPILFLSFSLTFLFTSCEQQFRKDDFKAYFGGEIVNPVNRYVLFCKGTEVIDTIPLKDNNTFFKVFDSLAPGLYSFKHEPEYQYVYFDKNDSLMVRVNTKDFDESVVFCGRGDQKNNFLMEVYLKNEVDKDKMFDKFDYDIEKFTKTSDATHQKLVDFYNDNKASIEWSDDFDVYAKAAVDFHHYLGKEVYPRVHKIRTGKDIAANLPPSYYDYRKSIDFNNVALAEYSPYITYISQMLNNVASQRVSQQLSATDYALETNVIKMKIADTLFKDIKLKNSVLNNIAFTYLLEDQNMVNNKKFLDIFHKYSKDKSLKNEITKIGNAVTLLEIGNALPNVDLVGLDGKLVATDKILTQKTVIFFWSNTLSSHFIAAHKKALDLMSRNPDYKFVAVNVDSNQDAWVTTISKYKFPGIVELRCNNFSDLKDKWAITKIHRTIILGEDGKIKNAFTNLFDAKFEDHLKAPSEAETHNTLAAK